MSCTVVWPVWVHIAEEQGEQITAESNIRGLYTKWISKSMPNKIKRKLWISSFFAILWSLWMHRNGIVFKQRELDVQGLCHVIKWRVALWSKAWKDKVPYPAEVLARNFQNIPMLFN
uniref:Reverse transcriptase zinc-binding domain-containing protein n=1 Tax=Opuntia streptacantha TaxID=393608 RepID=A0A7C9DIP6_OPUST